MGYYIVTFGLYVPAISISVFDYFVCRTTVGNHLTIFTYQGPFRGDDTIFTYK